MTLSIMQVETRLQTIHEILTVVRISFGWIDLCINQLLTIHEAPLFVAIKSWLTPITLIFTSISTPSWSWPRFYTTNGECTRLMLSKIGFKQRLITNLIQKFKLINFDPTFYLCLTFLPLWYEIIIFSHDSWILQDN